MTPEPSTEAEPEAAAPATEPSADSIDPNDIDWATVDLATFDWTSLDSIDQIDEEAVLQNPTYGNIDRDALAAAFPQPEAGSGGGTATVTIDGTTYQFDDFNCAFGHTNTQSDIYSFSSNAYGEVDGARVQFQVDVEDPEAEGRTEGPGVQPQLTLQDIDDFDNPSVDFFTRDDFSLTIDGDQLTGQGTIYDDVNFVELLPVTLNATCGPGSRR